MFIIETYINDLITECRDTFEDRLLYVGLQGSYLREEATENSDIDIMVVIDGLSVADLGSYRNVLKKSDISTNHAALSAAKTIC